jgi:hypothetical protein
MIIMEINKMTSTTSRFRATTPSFFTRLQLNEAADHDPKDDAHHVLIGVQVAFLIKSLIK